jgi:acyl-homoserine lactone synthase
MESRMVLIINAENRRLFGPELLAMHRQRKMLFVDERCWNVPVVGDLEIDRYDHDATTYLLAMSASDIHDVLGSVRLLPTETAHLMSDLFPHACRAEVPRGARIWEVSRLCIRSDIRSRRLRLALLWEMVGAVMETALLFGVEQVTFVANAALLPLALGCGWRADVLGPTLPDGDDEITAVAARVTPAALRNVRRRFGIVAPVTRFPVPVSRQAA